VPTGRLKASDAGIYGHIINLPYTKKPALLSMEKRAHTELVQAPDLSNNFTVIVNNQIPF